MFQTKIQLANPDKIDSVLKEIVQNSYEEVREERLLLCMECGDVDLYIAASNHEELQDAINENFEIDECGEIIKLEEHQQLMDDLYEYFLKLHKESNLFDFFPAGYYIVDGESRESETDMLGPKGLFSAPFEDAIKE
ncbi:MULTISPECIES: hypothetical protein [Peribacillus]|uniref:hypothetical protein n=1 Tax=Peribacillus TaxID=2675229 RepID=UPI0019140601|nr:MULTISPECIES: hypothetical protein [unclassified Peribacillus]MBK5441937.1 hypothetical protein [Peribacillus sp. TH24]MBK5463285.1 hypothetical protein [Peribacillus sp. TH27]MBK5483360.1 hypothetical protein [Peribacillus sp. TH16]MBK5501530.1 hypothetical protein [Peribacillus sp. TH14]WMX53539.1 hypothetical protein RE409_15710 [Peribacillus sp. R9-11]